MSQTRPRVLVTLLLLLLSPATLAQLSGPGLFWHDSSGGTAGSFVPDCVVHPIGAFPGETVIVQVWGDFQAPFGLFASLNQSACVKIPGVGGGLLLDSPFFLVATGVLAELTPCLSCPQAFAELVVQVPPTAPVGTTFLLQALSLGWSEPAFTVAIEVAVQ